MSERHEVHLPAILQAWPQLDAWMRIDPAETVTIFSGKVEIGQGIGTTLAQIVAEELDVAVARVRVVLADTARTPDEGYTAGSNSTQGSGGALRLAAAEARQRLLQRAAEEFDAPAARLLVQDGLIIDPVSEQQISYWQLQGGQPFDAPISAEAAPKAHTDYQIVGSSVPRLDLPGKVRGEPVFVADMRPPGLCWGRVVRGPGLGAELLAVDGTAVTAAPGVLAVVRDGSFLGVVGEEQAATNRAAARLAQAARWSQPPSLPPDEEMYDRLRATPSQDFLVVDGAPVDGPVPPIAPPADAAHTHRAVYKRPYLLHAALGPSAALAQWQAADQLTVWTHSQGVFSLQQALAQVLGLPPAQVRVVHVEGPGCYGHNGADDVALDAALLAGRVPGRPVLVQWSREEEFRWEPVGTAAVIAIQASLDGAGRVIDWNHDAWSYTHSGRPRPQPGTSGLLAAWEIGDGLPPPQPRPGRGVHGGIHRNADPLYAFPRRRVVKHFVPDSPLRTSSLRSLGAFANVFAIESFMDELAALAGVDPVDFRLRHLDDERARAVVEAAAAAAGWGTPLPADWGRGIGFAQYKNEKCYAAVVMELSVARERGEIRLERATVAADAGRVINPDGLRNQLEGGAVQAASWTLKEAVRFGPAGLQSLDWERYPILRFDEAPPVEVVLLDRPGQPPLGAGEAVQGPTPAAIANAVYAAAGVRLGQLPFTAARVQEAMQNAG